jgi:general secretion pathway protein A
MEADAMPQLLGTLTVARNDTLGQMLMVVYGDYRSRFLKVVLEANPHIRNADAIDVGDAVRFPAVPIGDIQHSPSGWWLKVDDADSMVHAYREAKRHPALRMIAVWDRRAGMQYGIFVHGYFLSAEAANSAMAKLAQDLSATAEIVSGWPPDTVFFSDPFAGKGRHG